MTTIAINLVLEVSLKQEDNKEVVQLHLMAFGVSSDIHQLLLQVNTYNIANTVSCVHACMHIKL